MLVIFFFNFGGPLAILQIQKHQIRRVIKGRTSPGVSENNLVKITVNSENKKKLISTQGKGFSIKARIHDLVHSRKVDDNNKVDRNTSYSQQAKLIARYNKDLQKKRKNKRNRYSLKVLNLVKKNYSKFQKDILATNQNKLSNSFGYYENYGTRSLDISSPPPKKNL